MTERFHAWLASLPLERQQALGHDYRQAARAAGVFVVAADGAEVPIPPLLTPVALPRSRLAEVAADAHAILSALDRLTALLMEDPLQAARRARLFSSFTALEAEGLATTWRDAQRLATARVDFLVDEAGRHQALEVNATIPAMQGYSDGIAETFIRQVGRARGLAPQRIETLLGDNGRNTDDLLASLLSHYARLGGRAASLRIAIVARAGDAQRGELEHYVARFGQLGHRAQIVTPEAIRLEADGARVEDFEPDLFYRHIFARRLAHDSPFARICLSPLRHRVLNPLASHLEVKGMLALLSATAAADADAQATRLTLDDDQRAAITRAVPWTRLCEAGPTHGPDGARIADLAGWLVEAREHLVLKKSWDYGGRSVFLGTDVEDEASQRRLRALLGREGTVDWADLVEHALSDSDAWVAQELVRAPLADFMRAEPSGLQKRSLYADLSAFTNLGADPIPSGGAVRASSSRIVNILGGGGLAPLLRQDVLEALLPPLGG